ncbi:MAG: CHASE3 domain-containing protein [Bdellovibrionia bacterium]
MPYSYTLLEQKDFSRKLRRIVALPIVLLLLLACALTAQIFHQRSVALEVDRIDRVISDINHIQTLMIDMETGFRGFLLSGDSKFLEPYDRALGSIQNEITLLDRSLEKSPDQQAKARQIESLLNSWIQYTNQRIAAAQASHPAGHAPPDVEGKRRMDELRGQVQSLIRTEENLRSEGARQWDQELIRTLILTFVLAILFGVLIGLHSRNQIESVATSYEKSIDRTRQSEEQYRALFDGIKDYGIYLLSVDGVVQKWNSGAERITGYSSSEMIGKNISIFYNEQSDSTETLSIILRHAKDEGHFEYEGWRPRKDGGRFWTYVLVTALYGTNGELRGYSVIMRDNSKRRQIEQERENLLKKLQEAVQARDEFLTLASHELKTPLTTLILRLQMIQKSARTVEESDLTSVPLSVIQKLERQTQRLRNLIDNMLDLSRITTHHFVLNLGPTSLAQILRTVVEDMRDQFREVGSSIVLEAQEDLTGNWDAFRIEQVLLNLLTNALRFCNSLPVHVRAEKMQNNHIRISVSDQGPGVPPQDKERIFERFGRIKSPNDAGGLGLGLYLSKEIIEAHDGSIRVESEPGKGATFIVELPA